LKPSLYKDIKKQELLSLKYLTQFPAVEINFFALGIFFPAVKNNFSQQGILIFTLQKHFP
jgi:hypothetical protein